MSASSLLIDPHLQCGGEGPVDDIRSANESGSGPIGNRPRVANPPHNLSRRQFVVVLAGGIAAVLPADPQTGGPPPGTVACRLTINAQPHDLVLDPRVSLLDLLREHLQLTGTKKGCDH